MYRQNKFYLGLLRSLSNSPVNLTKLSKFYEFYEFHWKLTCNLLATRSGRVEVKEDEEDEEIKEAEDVD